jgi:hypothetical protein
MKLIVYASALACIIYAAGASEMKHDVSLPSDVISGVMQVIDGAASLSSSAASSSSDPTKTQTALGKVQLSAKKLQELKVLLAKQAKEKAEIQAILRLVLEKQDNKELFELLKPILNDVYSS